MGIFDALTGAPGRRAVEENTGRLQGLQTQGMGYLDSGLNNSLASLGQGRDVLTDLNNKYGGVVDGYIGELGDTYKPSPGLEYATNAAVNANDRLMNSRGMLNSGNTVDATGNIAGKLALGDYNTWMQRKGAFVPLEMQSGQSLANLGAQEAGLYSNDANQRVGFASNITNGLNNQTTQGANNDMAASRNVIGLGMSLASLAAGGMGGGGAGGLFGGFGGTPDYGQTSNMRFGGTNMPMFGRA